jgi:hypothetical protein
LVSSGGKAVDRQQLLLDGAPVEPLRITVKAPEPVAVANVRLIDATGQLGAGAALLFVGATPEHFAVVPIVMPINATGILARVHLVPDQYRVYLADDGYDYDLFDDPDFLSAHANDFPPVRIVTGDNPQIVLTLRR